MIMEPNLFRDTILHQLPLEVITIILAKLQLKDLINVALVCKELRLLVLDNSALWRLKCRQMLTVGHAKTHNGLSNNYSLSAYNRCRISCNWRRGCFREMVIARSTMKYMPWICLKPDYLVLSTGFTLSCFGRDHRSLPSCKQVLWTVNLPKVTRRGVRTNDISRFVIKDNVIVCGNRDGCIAVYGYKSDVSTIQDYCTPVLRHHIQDCHEHGAAEVSAVDFLGCYGDMCIASASSECRTIKFWKQCYDDVDKNDMSSRQINANKSKHCKKSRTLYTCVRGVETTGGDGGTCLLIDTWENRLAVGLNGTNIPLVIDIETGRPLSNPSAMQNIRECVKDITWLNENVVVYVTHTGYLYCLDTRTERIVRCYGDMCIASASSECRTIKFWKQCYDDVDKNDMSSRQINANKSKHCKKSRTLYTCVRGVETTGGDGGTCLLIDTWENRLAVGLNGTNIPLVIDIETGRPLSNPSAMQNIRECVKDITWLNENVVVYVTHTGYLYCLDTRTERIVNQNFDPLATSLYSVKTDGQHAIVTGSSQSSRCTLYDARSTKRCVQILFTQKCSSPVYSVDFDASTLAAAAERGVAILNFNVNSANTRHRDYAAIVASFKNGNTAGLL